jgi:hypothetical protein
MAFSKLAMTAAALAVAATALPEAALAHGKKHKHRHYDDGRHYREVYYQPQPRYYAPSRGYYDAPRYRSGCRSGGTTGLIVGGAAGALLGREVDGGRDRTAGTVVGAAAGALLGREIDRKDRC